MTIPVMEKNMEIFPRNLAPSQSTGAMQRAEQENMTASRPAKYTKQNINVIVRAAGTRRGGGGGCPPRGQREVVHI